MPGPAVFVLAVLRPGRVHVPEAGPCEVPIAGSGDRGMVRWAIDLCAKVVRAAYIVRADEAVAVRGAVARSIYAAGLASGQVEIVHDASRGVQNVCPRGVRPSGNNGGAGE